MSHLTLTKNTGTIYSILLAVLSFYGTTETCTYAQEVVMKETWIKELTSIPSLYRADTLSICIMGDMMMHSKQIETAKKADGTYDFSSYFTHIEDRIKAADIAVANMEFCLAGEPYTGYPTFSAPDNYGEYLAQCGFDVFLAANNHIFDKGAAGAERTLMKFRELEKDYGIKVCGLSKDEDSREKSVPLKILRKGLRIAVVNFTYGTNLGCEKHWPKTNYMNEKSLILDALEKAEDCDLTIVFPHWGEEYELTHSVSQENTAVMLAENGADVIIGAHPHVPQDFGTVTSRNIPVAYSLGNAVSNMSAPNTQLELMAEISFVRNPDGSTRLLPIKFTYLWCSRPGGFSSSYTILPVKEYIDRKDEWKGTWDYDKMVTTYNRVKDIIRIEDN